VTTPAARRRPGVAHLAGPHQRGKPAGDNRPASPAPPQSNASPHHRDPVQAVGQPGPRRSPSSALDGAARLTASRPCRTAG